VIPPGYDGFLHYHDARTSSTSSIGCSVRVEEEVRESGPGVRHVESTTPRKFSNPGDDDLIVLVIGGRTAMSSDGIWSSPSGI
jgi:hypothetical protein